MKRALTAAVAVLVCLRFGALSRDDYPRAGDIDVIHYRIQIEIGDGPEINAETSITVALNNDGIRRVTLDFGALEIDQITEDAKPAKYVRDPERLNIELQNEHRRGDHCSIQIKYHGKPSDGLFIKKNKFGDHTIFADNWPNRAHHWFPAIDHPYDKATVEFFVSAPDRFDVVANGELIETTSNQNGRKLTHWRESVPIPVYCMVIGAGQFSAVNAGSWNGIPVWFYAYPKDRDHAMKDYGRAVRMLEFYSNLIGPYPYEKLALVQSSTRFGGMENSSNIFFDERRFDGSGKLEGTVAHEIAHQWFGDSVTEADWHHLWLSESFATYFGNLFFERTDGRERFLELMRADKEAYLKAYAANAPPIYDPAIKNLFDLLNRNNYEKGGWVRHMLRRLMGEEAFFAGIRDYYRTYRDRNALTEDLRRVMEFHAGRPLDWFFNQWIYQPGYPILNVSWRWNENTKQVALRVEQKQANSTFRIPLEIELRAAGEKHHEVIEVSNREQTFTFKQNGKPTIVEVDPDEWLLSVISVREDR